MSNATDLTSLSASTGVITASDFSDRLTDTDRNDWTAGKMRHLIAALDGRRVIITTDKQTGHSEFNVRLVGLTYGQGSNYPRVQVEYVYAPGKSQRTNFLLFNLGPVIIPMPAPMTDKRGKWAAMASWREETSAAIQVAHRLRTEQGLTGGHTIQQVKPGWHSVTVSYSPDHDQIKRWGADSRAPENRFWYTEVSMVAIANELERQAQVTADYQAKFEREQAGVPERCEA